MVSAANRLYLSQTPKIDVCDLPFAAFREVQYAGVVISDSDGDGIPNICDVD